MYLRFESYLRDSDYNYRLGIFQAAFALRDNEAVADYAREGMRCDIDWFKECLPSPDDYYFERCEPLYLKMNTLIIGLAPVINRTFFI